MPLLTLYPDGDGASVGWIPTPSGASYPCVLNLGESDADATHLDGTGDDSMTVLNFQQHPLMPHPVAAVAWVGVSARLKKTGIPAQMVAGMVRSGGVDLVLPVATVASVIYRNFDDVSNGWRTYLDPATGRAWGVAAGFASQVGISDATPDPTAHVVRCNRLRKLMWVEYESRVPPIGAV